MKAEEICFLLAKYALARPGAQLQFGGELTTASACCATVKIPGAQWTEFFEVCQQDNGYEAKIPVLSARLAAHQDTYSAIRRTHWKERDGHVQMAVPLDGSIPTDYLKDVVDEAFEIVWNKLDEDGRFTIELAGTACDERSLIDQLIIKHNLQGYRSEIQDLARPAILLRTQATNEADIPPGATRIGGIPDLPLNTVWPVCPDGKSLVFLAQIDLAEIAEHGTVIDGLPIDGMLSLFSVWGQVMKEDSDPYRPNDDWCEQTGWTQIIYSTSDEPLSPRTPPETVNTFPAAAVEPTPVLSLPNASVEPPVAALKWTENEYESFDDLQMDFRAIQMTRWFKSMNAFQSHHLLGGYALFQQQFPEELLDRESEMLLQIGTDSKTDMWWGDGGELTFYADGAALREGRFERIWGTCQGG